MRRVVYELNTPESPIIALGEAWGEFIGLFLVHRRYNIDPGFFRGSENFRSQLNAPNSDFAGLALESFNPRLTDDPFRWIPAGLMEDLRDASNETGPIPVIDGVSNFTIEQLFNPLQSDVSSIPAYRTRLQQQNTGNQTNQVTNLFAQYGY